jgi:5'-phosphate synthase pdxT subunit
MRIGVLELQGDFEKHHQILQTLGMDSVAVRGPSDLEELEGLIIPGGESTTISLLIDRNKLREPLKAFADVHPVLGTCAGLILMA